MKLEAAEKMIIRLMTKHGLIEQGWSWKLDRGITRLGVTIHSRKHIGISANMVDLSPAEYVKETILHEIAHALSHPSAGHGASWQRLVERIGGSSARLSDNPYVAPTNSKPRMALKGRRSPSSTVTSANKLVTIGSTLLMPNGQRLKVTKRAQVNYQTLDERTGQKYNVRIEHAHKYLV